MRRPAALLAALLLLVGACTVGSDDEPEPAAASPSATSAADTDQTQARIDEIAGEVSALRDLPMDGDLDADLVTSDELADIAIETAELDSEEEADVRDVERLLQTLRFLDADVDLLQAQRELLRGGVIAGLYVPEDEALYVSADEEGLTPQTEVTAAHEITHALQDQRFDLERINDYDTSEGDAATAFQAVVEGDAVLTEQAWLAEHLTAEEREEYQRSVNDIGADIAPSLEDAPPYLVQSLVFPYQAGPPFLRAVIQAQGEEGRDAALEDPPVSTLELLAPGRYLEGFEPAELEIDDALGDGWRRGFEGTFGAFELLFALSQAPDAITGVGNAVRAWDGGWAAGFTGPDGQEAAAVTLEFNDAQASATACEGLRSWWASTAGAPTDGRGPGGDTLPAGDGRSVLVLDCAPTGLSFGVGPDAELARRAAGL